MRVRREKNNQPQVVLEEIEPFFLELLRSLPESSDPGDHPAARARLFSAPMSPESDGDEFNDDWKSYVEPELQELFQSAREIVIGDLAQLPPAAAHPPVGSFESAAFAPSEDTLEIPLRHAEAWLSVLNQARLSIAARHGFGEREIEAGWPLPPFTDRDLDLFRLHFFEEMQQILLSALGYD